MPPLPRGATISYCRCGPEVSLTLGDYRTRVASSECDLFGYSAGTEKRLSPLKESFDERYCRARHHRAVRAHDAQQRRDPAHTEPRRALQSALVTNDRRGR